MSEMSTEELRENFNHFDANHDGRIDATEFNRLMAALGVCEPGEDCAIGFAAIDTDGSGVVEFDEFARWLSSR